MTDKFSAEATNINDVPNHVTIKQGISDPSISTALEGVAKGVRGAAQAYGTIKSRQGYKDMEAAFLEELTATASTESLKEFSNSVDRANQQLAIGRADRAELRLDAELRKRVRAEPLLADRYRAIYNRLKGEYSKTLSVIRGIEDEAKAARDRQMSGMISMSQAYVQKGIPVLNDEGQPISPYVATEEQLLRHHAHAGGQINFDELVKKAQAARKNEIAEIRLNQSIETHNQQTTVYNQGQQEYFTGQALAQAQANSAFLLNTVIDNGLQTGEAFSDPVKFEQNLLLASSAVRQQLLKDIQKLPLNQSQLASLTADVNNQFNAASQFFGDGKLAFAARQGRLLEQLKTNSGISLYQVAGPLANVLNALPIGMLQNPALLGILGVDAKTFSGFTNIFKEGYTNVNTEFTKKANNFYDVLKGNKAASRDQVPGLLRFAKELNSNGEPLPNPADYANIITESANSIQQVDAGERADLYQQLTQGHALNYIAQIPEGADRDRAVESYRKILQAQAGDYLMYNNIDPKGFVFDPETESFSGKSVEQKVAADDINVLLSRAKQANEKSGKKVESTDLAVHLVPLAWGNIMQPKSENSDNAGTE